MTDDTPRGNPPDDTPEEDPTSVAGKGWDILMGGKGNVPEDADAQPTSDEGGATLPEEPPISEDDTLANMPPAPQPGGGGTPMPEDAIYDQGRGPEFEAPEPVEEGTPPTPGEDIPQAFPDPVEEAAAPGEALPEEPPTEPEATPGGGLDMDQLTSEPEVEPEVAIPPQGGEPGPGSGDSVADLFDAFSQTSGGEVPPAQPAADTPPQTGQPSTPPVVSPSVLESALGGIGPDDFLADSGRGATIRRDAATEDLEADENLLNMLVTPARLNALWDEINELYDLVVNDVRGHYKTTDQSLYDLKKARELLLAGRENYDNAEQLVKGVKARLRLEEKVRQWSRTRGTLIALYLIFWLVLLSLSSVIIPTITVVITALGVPDILIGTILPGLFGGLGGVIGGLWVLVKHTSIKRDFDPIHTPWFLVNPFLGTALGVVTYFIVIVLSAVGTTLIGSGTEINVDSTPVLIYALCVVVGFRQNVFWNLIESFLRAVLPDVGDDDDSAEPDIAQTDAPQMTVEPPTSTPPQSGGAG